MNWYIMKNMVTLKDSMKETFAVINEDKIHYFKKTNVVLLFVPVYRCIDEFK
jgi:hypothetical protein